MMGQPIHWRNKLNRISSQDPKRRGKVVFALLIDPAKRNNSIHCLQSVDWPIFQLLFFLIHYNPVCSEIILNILELIASLILNTAMLSVQQAKKSYNYFYTLSHVTIHLLVYHFAYLTVDITFVVENINLLKPWSKPFRSRTRYIIIM